MYDGGFESMSFPEGVTILLNDTFPSDGKLVEWKGHFVKYNEIHFQIWRPVDGSDTEFVNVYDQKFDCECKGLDLGQEIGVDVTDDVQVQANDRIGLAVQEGTLGIGYTKIPPEKYLAADYSDVTQLDDRKMTFESKDFKVKLFVKAIYEEK